MTTTMEDLRKMLPQLKKQAEAIPYWKKVVLNRQYVTEVQLGYINDPNLEHIPFKGLS
jgi:hypothetical protein